MGTEDLHASAEDDADDAATEAAEEGAREAGNDTEKESTKGDKSQYDDGGQKVPDYVDPPMSPKK